MIYSYKTIDLEVKDVDTKKGIVTGYFASFNVKDSDGDITRPGAFLRSIQDWGPNGKKRIKHLFNHNPGQPVGNLEVLQEDDFGLYYESLAGTHNLGRDFIKMVESKLITEHSYGFNDVTPAAKRKGDGHNNITDVILFEGSSLSGWGANQYTPLVSLKGKSTEDLATRLKAFEKFVRNTDATDETIELCILQIKQLGQVIETMSSTQSVVETVEQPKQDNDAVIDSKTITNSFTEWKKNFKMH
jgi:HK97 family phage prohead protease